MDLIGLLRELRLLKGQSAYRFCLAWLVVFSHVVVRPSIICLCVVVYISRLDDEPVAAAFVALLFQLIGRLLNSLDLA